MLWKADPVVGGGGGAVPVMLELWQVSRLVSVEVQSETQWRCVGELVGALVLLPLLFHVVEALVGVLLFC